MITNIQILRAIAAIIVIAFHAVLASEKYSLPTNFFYKIDVWGAAGVDIFFIISGFIMVYIQYKKKRNSFDFLMDRVERILPLYWALTLLISFLLVIFPQGFNELALNSNALLNSLFFISFLSSQAPLIYIGWTLEYEMLFYLVFGLTLLIKNEKFAFLSCIAILCSMVLLGLNSIIVEFVYGMIIGLLFIKYRISIKNKYCLIMIFLGFGLLTIEWSDEIARCITWGLPSILIFIGSLYLKPIKNKILELLGSASYSMYLVQVFSIPIFFKVITMVSFLNKPQLSEFHVMLCILLSVFSGLILHLMIEKPLSRLFYNLKMKKNKDRTMVV